VIIEHMGEYVQDSHPDIVRLIVLSAAMEGNGEAGFTGQCIGMLGPKLFAQVLGSIALQRLGSWQITRFTEASGQVDRASKRRWVVVAKRAAHVFQRVAGQLKSLLEFAGAAQVYSQVVRGDQRVGVVAAQT
jgi:hypothetical protein